MFILLLFVLIPLAFLNTCFNPALLYMYDNCVESGSRRMLETDYDCFNQGDNVSFPLFFIGKDVSTIGGEHYTEYGDVTDLSNLIQVTHPEFVIVSLWVDPTSHVKVNIYSILFEWNSIGGYIDIDDGVHEVLRCDACFDTGPGIHNYIIKISTDYYGGPHILIIRRNGETVFANNLPTMSFTSTPLEFHEFSQEEHYFKVSMYLGDLHDEALDTLFENGYNTPDGLVCQADQNCTVYYHDLIDIYIQLQDIYILLKQGKNWTEVIELLKEIKYDMNMSFTEVVNILNEFYEHTEIELTNIVSLLNQLITQLNYNATTIINLLNELTCGECNQTLVLQKLDRNFEKLELIISLLSGLNTTNHEAYFNVIIQMLHINEEYLEQIIILLQNSTNENLYYFEQILIRIDDISNQINVNVTYIINLLEAISCGDCNQTLLLERIDKNLEKLETIIELLRGFNSTNFEQYLNIIVYMLTINEAYFEEILYLLHNSTHLDLYYFEQILHEINELSTQVNINITTLISILEEISCGDCNQTLLLEKIHINFLKLEEILAFLKSMNTSYVDDYFQVLLDIVLLNQESLQVVINLLANSTESNLHYLLEIINKINQLTLTLNTHAEVIITLLNNMKCGNCNQTVLEIMLLNNLNKLEIIINLLNGLNGTSAYNFNLIITLLELNEEHLVTIINLINNDTNIDIKYFHQIINLINDLKNESCPTYDHFFELILIRLEEIEGQLCCYNDSSLVKKLDECLEIQACRYPYALVDGNCTLITCWDLLYNDPLVCNAKGVCVDINVCECYTNYFGFDCNDTLLDDEVECDENCTAISELLDECQEKVDGQFIVQNWRYYIPGIMVAVGLCCCLIVFLIFLLSLRRDPWRERRYYEAQKKQESE